MATLSGYTAETAKHLMLDSGAFYKDFVVGTDTPTTASAKLLGATRGGGEFNAVPDVRQMEVDGVKGNVKGGSRFNSWDVNILSNMLEITPDILKDALGAATIDTTTSADYDIIKAKNCIEDDDYIDNITWIGTLSGGGCGDTGKYVIIQIYNAMGSEGIALAPVDNDESVLGVRFTAHYDGTDLDTPPFAIYYPKLA